MDKGLTTWLGQEQTASSIQELLKNQFQDADAVDQVLPFTGQPDTQFNALWLLKTIVIKGRITLKAAQTEMLLKQVQHVYEPQRLLLLMQCASHITLTEASLPTWEKLVQRSRACGNKFTQAHSYTGFLPMVKLLPALKTEAVLILEEDYAYGSKAVQARIRKVRKALELL